MFTTLNIVIVIAITAAVACLLVHFYQEMKKDEAKEIEDAKAKDSKALGYMVQDLTKPKKRTYKRRAGT